MREAISKLKECLQLPFWQRAEIAAEFESHFEEVRAELQTAGLSRHAAEKEALARLGDLGPVSEQLEDIYRGWTGGATVQHRLFKLATMALIFISLLAIPLVPQLREMARQIAKSAARTEAAYYPSREELEAIAARHPEDVFVQLAVEMKKPFGDSFTRPVRLNQELYSKGLEQVADRFTQSATAQLLWGHALLSEIGGLQREEEYLRLDPDERPQLEERTEEQAANLAAAIERLNQAAALDPENAAPYCFLAYAYFAAKDDAKAQAALTEVLKRERWTTYEKEIRTALLATLEEADVPDIYLTSSHQALSHMAPGQPPNATTRAVARMAAALAEKERQAGNDEAALAYYERMLYLSEIQWETASSFVSALMTSATTSILTTYFIDEAEMERVKQQTPKRDERIERYAEIRSQHFSDYLRTQGREDLAQSFEKISTQKSLAKEALRSQSDKSKQRLYAAVGSRSMVIAMTLWVCLSYVFGLLIIVGVWSLVARWWQEKGLAPDWRWWEWAALVATAFVPLMATMTILSKSFLQSGESGPPMIAYLAMGAPLLFVIVPIAGGLGKRKAQPAEMQMSRGHAVLASFRILLPPTFAVLLAVALVFTVFGQLSIERWAAQEKQAIIQGEMQYLGQDGLMLHDK